MSTTWVLPGVGGPKGGREEDINPETHCISRWVGGGLDWTETFPSKHFFEFALMFLSMFARFFGVFACRSTARHRNINTCARAHQRITHPRPVDGGVWESFHQTRPGVISPISRRSRD